MMRFPNRRIIVAIIAALLLVLAVVVLLPTLFSAQAHQEPPDFAASHKTGPQSADAGDAITYTIVVSNAGGAVADATLSDTLPPGLALAGCRYEVAGSASAPCTPPLLWMADLDAGARVTTTVVATVTVEGTAGTARWPLVNCAYLGWGDGGQWEMCAGTTVNPDHVYLPLVMAGWPAWWANYPLCPGEDIDRGGFGEEGGNDRWDPYNSPPLLPVPYACVGWIHWAIPYGSVGEVSDKDYVYYEITAADLGRTIQVTLTWLPVDYKIVYNYPNYGESGSSANSDTQDEVLELPATVLGVYTLKIHSQVFGHDPPIPEYDPVNPYLLIVEDMP